MKREDIIKILGEDADKDKVTALLDAMHAEISAHKDAASQAQAALAEKGKELEAAAATAKDAEDLRGKLAELQTKYEAEAQAAARRLEALQLEALVDGAIRDAKGRNLKAIKALMDMDALAASKNQQADAQAAVAALAGAQDSAFLFGPPDPKPTGQRADVGGRTDGVPPEENPWAKETWNMGKQAQIYKENPTLAKTLAQQAGKSILEG